MKKFTTFYIDPPWPYQGSLVGNGGRGSQNGKAKQIVQVGVKNHYPTMTIEQLKKLPISALARPNAHLYLWTTNTFMEEAHQLIREWGFHHKTIITWGKVKKDDPTTASMKCGYYYRSATEHLLFAVRGKLRLKGPCSPTLHLLERESHSVKPDYFYELIEQQSPGPYLELFARRKREGWGQWGNEIKSTIKIA